MRDYKLGQNDDAITAYTQSIKLKPDGHTPYFGIADVYFYNLKKYPDAIAQYREGLRYKADHPTALKTSDGPTTKLQKYDEALSPLQEAMRLLPNDALVHTELGVTYAGLGRDKDAAEAYKASNPSRPEERADTLHLGLSYVKLGDRAAREQGVPDTDGPQESEEGQESSRHK
jgi:tetratricopeptide (TPR) repeat protein